MKIKGIWREYYLKIFDIKKAPNWDFYYLRINIPIISSFGGLPREILRICAIATVTPGVTSINQPGFLNSIVSPDSIIIAVPDNPPSDVETINTSLFINELSTCLSLKLLAQ